MRAIHVTMFELTLAMLGLFVVFLDGTQRAFAVETGAYEVKLPDNAPVQRFDFEQNGIQDWKTVDGQWNVEEAKDASSGKRVLVQRALENTYNVVVAPGGPYADVDVSVRFKPISGK